MATEAVARGHEISCHGDRWESPAHLEEAAERAMIARAVAALERIGGVCPRGWHSRSAPSVHTRRLVVEHGGFLYDSNAYHDDLPYVVDVAGTQHVVVPYSFDTNDRRFSQAETFRLAADCSTSLLDAFDWLWREGERWPRLRSVGLHLRSIGRPGRIGGLERFLAHLHQPRDAVWIARRDAIAWHWRRRMGLPPLAA
jgi:peptidoglycan/xylan/chitin deacetylase (PgdA/CDA1 family)